MNYILGMRTDTIVELFGMAISWQAYLLLILCNAISACIVWWGVAWVHDLYRGKVLAGK